MARLGLGATLSGLDSGSRLAVMSTDTDKSFKWADNDYGHMETGTLGMNWSNGVTIGVAVKMKQDVGNGGDVTFFSLGSWDNTNSNHTFIECGLRGWSPDGENQYRAQYIRTQVLGSYAIANGQNMGSPINTNEWHYFVYTIKPRDDGTGRWDCGFHRSLEGGTAYDVTPALAQGVDWSMGGGIDYNRPWVARGCQNRNLNHFTGHMDRLTVHNNVFDFNTVIKPMMEDPSSKALPAAMTDEKVWWDFNDGDVMRNLSFVTDTFEGSGGGENLTMTKNLNSESAWSETSFIEEAF